jgi:hypothetical protein
MDGRSRVVIFFGYHDTPLGSLSPGEPAEFTMD